MIQTRRFERSSIRELIKGLFISEQVGTPKPNKEFFDAVFASVSDFDKSKAVMIGDSLSSDIRGGINAGITTIWYNPHLKRNDLGVCPDYTATSYEQVLRILHSETGRVPPHVSVLAKHNANKPG